MLRLSEPLDDGLMGSLPHSLKSLDTVNCSAEENAERIVLYLMERG